MTDKLKKLIERWEASGRVAHVYPKLKGVSLNGFPRKTYKEAEKYIQEAIQEGRI